MQFFNVNFDDQIPQRILEDIAISKGSVKFGSYYHYYIEMNLVECSQLWLSLDWDTKLGEYILKIRTFLGEKMPEARAFYKRLKYVDFEKICEKKWTLHPNLNLSCQGTKLIWIYSKTAKNYIDYWNQNIAAIGRYNKVDGLVFLNDVNAQGVIDFNSQKQVDYTNNFTNTKRDVDINPSLCIEYIISQKDFIEMDRNKTLSDYIGNTIKEGFKTIGLNTTFLK